MYQDFVKRKSILISRQCVGVTIEAVEKIGRLRIVFCKHHEKNPRFNNTIIVNTKQYFKIKANRWR